MGADMLLSVVPCPAEITDEHLESLRNVLKGLGADDLEPCLTDYIDSTGDDEIDIRGYVLVLHECIDGLRDLNDSRETCGLYVKGVRYLVSGGLSWGDLPTEACSEIDKLASCEQLTTALEEMSRAYEASRHVSV